MAVLGIVKQCRMLRAAQPGNDCRIVRWISEEMQRLLGIRTGFLSDKGYDLIGLCRALIYRIVVH